MVKVGCDHNKMEPPSIDTAQGAIFLNTLQLEEAGVVDQIFSIEAEEVPESNQLLLTEENTHSSTVKIEPESIQGGCTQEVIEVEEMEIKIEDDDWQEDENTSLQNSSDVYFSCEHCLDSFASLLELDKHEVVCRQKKILEGNVESPKVRPNLKSVSETTVPSKLNKFNNGKRKTLKRLCQDKKINVCGICNRFFRSASSLKWHKHSHSRSKPVKCSECDYATFSLYSLGWHMGKRHSLTNQEEEEAFNYYEEYEGSKLAMETHTYSKNSFSPKTNSRYIHNTTELTPATVCSQELNESSSVEIQSYTDNLTTTQPTLNQVERVSTRKPSQLQTKSPSSQAEVHESVSLPTLELVQNAIQSISSTQQSQKLPTAVLPLENLSSMAYIFILPSKTANATTTQVPSTPISTTSVRTTSISTPLVTKTSIPKTPVSESTVPKKSPISTRSVSKTLISKTPVSESTIPQKSASPTPTASDLPAASLESDTSDTDTEYYSPKRKKPSKMFYCTECSYKTVWSHNLRTHTRLHTGEKPLSCSQCDMKFSDPSCLNKHIKRHLGIKPHMCELCGFRGITKAALRSHMIVHSDERPFSCDQCDFKGKHKYNLTAHKATHTEEKPHLCSECGYRTAHIRLYKRHLEKHADNTYSCSHCKYQTKVLMHFNRHMKNHTGENPYKCPYNECNYSTSYKNNLQTHIRTHTGEKPLSCPMCDAKFSDPSLLNLHKKKHLGIKPHACNLCDYKTALKASLASHMRIHSGEKPFSCTYCDFKCRQKSNLIEHTRSHTGEKPYACSQCLFRTAYSCKLKRHILSHTGERPHLCAECGTSFRERSQLTVHMRVHTGEKPYECQHCDFRAGRKINLKKHLKRKHPEDLAVDLIL